MKQISWMMIIAAVIGIFIPAQLVTAEQTHIFFGRRLQESELDEFNRSRNRDQLWADEGRRFVVAGDYAETVSDSIRLIGSECDVSLTNVCMSCKDNLLGGGKCSLKIDYPDTISLIEVSFTDSSGILSEGVLITGQAKGGNLGFNLEILDDHLAKGEDGIQLFAPSVSGVRLGEGASIQIKAEGYAECSLRRISIYTDRSGPRIGFGKAEDSGKNLSYLLDQPFDGQHSKVAVRGDRDSTLFTALVRDQLPKKSSRRDPTALQDGRYYGQCKLLNTVQGRKVMHIAFQEFLTGKAAENYAAETGTEVYNDYIVKDLNRMEQLEIHQQARIKVITMYAKYYINIPETDDHYTAIDFPTLDELLRKNKHALSNIWIEVKNSKIVLIEEQYVP